MQINNLKCTFSKTYGKYQVKTLDGKILEEFKNIADAYVYMHQTKDFVKRKKKA